MVAVGCLLDVTLGEFVEQGVDVRDVAPGGLPIVSPVRRAHQFVVFLLRCGGDDPDADAKTFPKRPLEALGLGKRVSLGLFAVDPTLSVSRVRRSGPCPGFRMFPIVPCPKQSGWFPNF